MSSNPYSITSVECKSVQQYVIEHSGCCARDVEKAFTKNGKVTLILKTLTEEGKLVRYKEIRDRVLRSDIVWTSPIYCYYPVEEVA
jgi:hypothetical protein